MTPDRQPDSEPIEEEVVSEVVGDGDDARVVAQENLAGRDNIEGGGEWPDPDTPPSPEARGADPADREALERRRKAP
jgi:hypothetical protein